MANNLLGGRPRLSEEELMELYGPDAANIVTQNEQPRRSTPSSTGILGGFSPQDIGDYGQPASTDGRGTNTPSRDPMAGQGNPNSILGGMSASDLNNPVIMDQFSQEARDTSRDVPDGRGTNTPSRDPRAGQNPVNRPQYNLDVRQSIEDFGQGSEQEQLSDEQKEVTKRVTEKALQDPDLSQSQRQRIVEKYEEQRSKFNLPALFAGIGATLQGGSGAEGASRILQQERQDFQDRLSAFDTEREQQYEDEIRQRDRRTYENNRDPNSAKSKLARQLMQNMNEDVPEDFTYQQMIEFNPVLGQLFDRQMQQAKLQQEAAIRNREFGLENRRLNQETEARAAYGGEYVSEEEAQNVRETVPQIDSTRSSIESSIKAIQEGGDMTDIRNNLTAVKADLRNLIEKGAIQQFSEEELDDLLYSGRWTTDGTRVQKLQYLDSLLTGARQDVIGQGTRSSAQQNLNQPTSEFDTRNTNATVRMIGPNGATYDVPQQLVGEAQARGLKPQ